MVCLIFFDIGREGSSVFHIDDSECGSGVTRKGSRRRRSFIEISSSCLASAAGAPCESERIAAKELPAKFEIVDYVEHDE
jgi:hypothetical protein